MSNKDNALYIGNIKNLVLRDTLDCGQAFRWSELPDGSFGGVAFGSYVEAFMDEDQLYLRYGKEEDLERWKDYFDLGTDYEILKTEYATDPVMEKAIAFAPGIRVLKQDGFEALISFIISQNNNIKRIKGIVERLCECYGEKVSDNGYSFPTAEALAAITADDLAPLKAGFRARYIIDAATKVASGEVDLSSLYEMPLDDARAELMKIVGVGRKVADCALLYGFHRVECYPVDVWIKRVDKHLFPNGLPEVIVPTAGLAQQYLFHYVRVCPEALEGAETSEDDTKKKPKKKTNSKK